MKNRRKYLLFFFIILNFIFTTWRAAMSDDRDPGLTRLLPASIDGWNILEDHLYNRENLYEYINGGAELYLSFGFQTVLSRTYFRTDQPKIIVDLFDMRESANAFGVFCHTREVVNTTFGQGSQYFPGLLTFWKDHYYVSILASPETPESKQAVEDLAREIEKSIKQSGSLPELLKYLPPKNLKEESIRYFTHSAWLNSYFFIADENIFQIGQGAPAVLARYSDQGILLLVQYQEPTQAQEAYQAFEKYFASQNTFQETAKAIPLSDPKGENPAVRSLFGIRIIQLEDGSWAGARFYDRQFTAVFQGAGESEVSRLLNAAWDTYDKMQLK
jgi:hypothetical protein